MRVRENKLAAAVCAMGLLLPAVSQADSVWNIPGDGLWSDASDWSPPVVPDGGVNVDIVNGTSTVTLDISPTIGTLQLATGNGLDTESTTTLAVNGPTIINAGAIDLEGQLRMNGDIALSGAGTLTLGANGQIGGDSYARTLTNDSTIQGAGLIGSNVGALYSNISLTNNGTINATGAMAIQDQGGNFTNTALLEATAGGTLTLSTAAALNNSGGTITASGTGSAVTVNISIQGGTLTTTGGGVIQNGGGTAKLDGATSGALTISDGSTFDATTAGLTQLQGTINLGTTTGSTLAVTGQVQLNGGDVTLNGPAGALVTMSGSAQFGTDSFNRTLTNNVTIQGNGVIGSNIGSLNQNLSLINSGTINATGGSLSIQGNGGAVTNTGLLEATAGGTLALSTTAAVNNLGGTITASGSGSTVTVNNTIQGGTLTTVGGGVMQTGTGAFLDGATQGAITLSDGSSYNAGTSGLTQLLGTIKLGTTKGSTLTVTGQVQLNGGDVTLSGPAGALVTMVSVSGSVPQFGTDSYGRTLTNNVTIQGNGVIGSNIGSLYKNLSLINNGTIDATGGTLSIQGNGAAITNPGLLEATAGGTLALSTTAAVNNLSGMITASGSGSTVTINNTIQGGTLTTTSGGVMQTGTGAFLDGANQGAITISDGSSYSAGTSGLTQLLGTINLGTTTGSTLAVTGQVQLNGGDVTLNGPAGALVTMSGSAQFGTDSFGRTLTNNVTIQGNGVIGSNIGSLDQNLSLINNGTIDATGGTLSIQGNGAAITNTGLLEATAGGTLALSTTAAVNNLGGTITASGSGSTVTVNNTIQGGTLTTVGGGVMQTGTGAFLDGATQGAITLSDGSSYNAGTSGLTQLDGTIKLGTTTGSTLAVTGQVQLNGGDVTLNGPAGALVTMSGSAQFGTDSFGRTLTNNVTIQGNGVIGSNIGLLYQNLSLTNNGTIEATGGTLTLGGTGTITNNGIFQADSAATLAVSSSLSNYSPGTSTITGGSFKAYSGTIVLSQASTASSQVITTNSATILLDGSTAAITDSNGNNLLEGYFQNNTSTGQFTIQNGVLLTSAAADFTNAGRFTIGAASHFSVDQAHSFLNSGTLEGTGTLVAGLLDNSGTVHPGLSPGVLTVSSGSYLQETSGILDIQIGGAAPGTGYSQLAVDIAAQLNGTLDLSLINGFTPTNGEQFVILTSNGLTGMFSTLNGLQEGNTTFTVQYSPAGFANDVVLTAEVPEPASVAIAGIAIAALSVGRRKRRVV